MRSEVVGSVGPRCLLAHAGVTCGQPAAQSRPPRNIHSSSDQLETYVRNYEYCGHALPFGLHERMNAGQLWQFVENVRGAAQVVEAEPV